TAVEGATGGQAVSQKVCGTAGSSGTTNCGTNTGGQNTNGKLSTAFNADGAEAISSMSTNISTSGMAIPV
ncbi:MAG: P44/Msp2 family outer membrane protein, partial [Anaplasma ovis]